MSKVIKGDPADSTPTPTSPRGRAVIIPSAVYDAEARAEQILAAARRHADEIVAQARAEWTRIREEAAEQGRSEGQEEAVGLLARAQGVRARLLADAEEDIARLAVQIARKILGAELALGPDAIGRIVSSALGSARLGRSIVVRAHPDDLHGLEASRPTLLAAAGRSEGLVLRADPSIGRGGCIVESELGTIDARLDTQLDAIERALSGSTER
ncbi:MAG: type III secretion system stator protein SctL [Deltaproteobacteria bacterium]|nr:type III secretion system stator protein SctL [Deltaproteobacteria bacterium]